MQNMLGFVNSRPSILLIMATLMWAGHANVLKASIGEISPMLLMWFRWVGCSILLSLFLWSDIKKYRQLVKNNLPWVGIMGGFGIAGFTICLIVSAHYTSVINLGITQSFIPALIMILGLKILGTSISRIQGLGLTLSLIGALILVTKGSLQTLISLTFNFGDFVMLTGCICYAGYTLGLSKGIEIPPLVLFLFFSFFASLTLSFCVLIEFLSNKLMWPSTKGCFIVIYCIIFPSILAQTFFMQGVKLIGANRAGLYVNLVPIFTALLAVIFLSEELLLFHILSLTLVLSGIYVTDKFK